ncbi:SDR family NAD(P)-dependent oxidoreductase [Streptomyces indonesiensis]
MEHALDSFRTHVEAVEMHEPRGQVFANTRGVAYGDDIAANRQALAEQLVHPVDFATRVEEMYESGFRVFVEFGPKGLLTGLVRRTLGDREHVALPLDGGPGKDADVALKQGVAQLAVLGLELTTADRYVAPVPAEEPQKGRTVLLNGINYVSSERRAAYRDALENGYQVVLPTESAPAPVPEAQPVAVAAPAPVPAAPTAKETAHLDMAATPATDRLADYLALHDDYLTGQLRSADRLAALLERAAAQGRTADVLPGVNAVKEHGLAIGRTHLRVNEILRDLASLEHGTAPVRGPMRTRARRGRRPARALSRWPGPLRPSRRLRSRPRPRLLLPWIRLPTPLDKASVEAALLEIVAEKTGYPADMLDLDMGVEVDLGIDSIKRVEIMGVLQERFSADVAAGPEQLAELRTLGDIVTFVSGQASDTGIPAAPADTTTPKAPTAGTALGRIGRSQAALRTLPTPDKLVDAYPKDGGALLIDDGSELIAALNEQLAEAGLRVHTLRLPGVPERGEADKGAKEHALSDWSETELGTHVEEILGDGDGKGLSLVLDIAAEATRSWADGVRRLAYSLLVAKHVVEPLAKAAADGRAAFVTVTRLDGAFGATGLDEELVPASGVTGLVKTMAVEQPSVFCRALDLAPALDADSAARLVLAEAYDAAAEPTQVGLDGTRRVGLGLGDTPSYASGVEDAPDVGADDLLVVTGGARGITAACTAELARRHRPGLLLLGRTPLEDEPAWARGVEEAGLKAAAALALKAEGEQLTPKRVEELFRAVTGAREIRQTLERVRESGGEAEYLAVDITDPAATAASLAPYRERVTGLVHGAGVLADQLIANKKASEVERVFAPKLAGLRSVMAALDADKLRHVVLFSSVAGFFGNRGQSDYAMANETLNAWAVSWKQHHPRARVTSLNWGAWDSGMVSPEIKAVFEERGITLIPVDEGASSSPSSSPPSAPVMSSPSLARPPRCPSVSRSHAPPL